MIYQEILEVMGWPFTMAYGVLLLGFAYFILVSLPKALKTKKWPVVMGTVVSSSLRERKRLTSKGGNIKLYSAEVEYVYAVNQKEYTSNRIKWVDHSSSNKKYHQKIVDKYTVNRSVEIFYDANKPSVSLLEPGPGSGSFIVFAFFVLSMGAMSFVLLGKL